MNHLGRKFFNLIFLNSHFFSLFIFLFFQTEEIKRMTKAEVKAYREELDNITVKGVDCPKPIKTWAQCGLNLKMMNVLKKWVLKKLKIEKRHCNFRSNENGFCSNFHFKNLKQAFFRKSNFNKSTQNWKRYQ